MFKLPKPIMPTEEEILQMATTWWQDHEQINFLDWNEQLVENSIPFRSVKINKDFGREIIDALDTRKNNDRIISNLRSVTSDVMKEYNPFFFKLITRSGKDWLSDDSGKIKPLTTVEEVFTSLLASIRLPEDYIMLYPIDKFIMIFRPYIDIDQRNEWRVFIEGGKISGITQYFYQYKFDYSEVELKDIEYRIRDFVGSVVVPNVMKSDYVCDLIVDDQKVTLIELNPFGLSDPCLLDYGTMNGQLVINK